jgi:predicted metalloendopeptidase
LHKTKRKSEQILDFKKWWTSKRQVDAVRARTGKLIESYNVTELRQLDLKVGGTS